MEDTLPATGSLENKNRAPFPSVSMAGNSAMRRALLVTLVAAVVAGVLPAAAAAENETGVMTQPPGGGMDPAGLNVVLIESTGFAPDPVTIRAGDAMTWVNNDTSPHAIISAMPGAGGSPGINSGVIAPGGRFTFVFTEPGTYVYRSTTTGMTGTILVGGMGPGQPSGNVTMEETAGATRVPGGSEEMASLPSASPQPLPGNATPGVDPEIPPAEGPAGVISMNQTPAELRTNRPSGSGVAPGAPGTPTMTETTAMAGSEQSSTTPNQTPSSMAVAIGALAVVGLWIVVEMRR